MDTPKDVLGRAARVLRELSRSPEGGSTTSQVARGTGLARATAHRLLASLYAEGLADRDPSSGRWWLGPEVFLLGTSAATRYDVTAIAQPVVRRLAVRTGESASFSVRRGDETVCLLHEEGSFPIRSHVLYPGARFPLGVASAGMAILAHLPDAEVGQYLRRVALTPTWGEGHSEAAVAEHLEATRRTGYSVNPGLVVEGSWGIGAAVFDAREQPRWALSLTGVEHRFAGEREHELGDVLLQEAHQLTRQLAGSGHR